MKDTCNQEHRLAAYLDKRLTEEERGRYEMHLSECPRCRAELVAIQSELDEMGLKLAAREAIARQSADAQAGKRISPLVRAGQWAREFISVRDRAWGGIAVVTSAAAILIVAGFLLLPRLVPSWDPDLRRGKENLEEILASADIGQLRLVGGAPRPVDRRVSLRGVQPSLKESFARAEESLQKALLRHPDDPRAYRMLGDLYVSAGEAERAATAYRRALLIKPGDPALLNDLAVAVFRTGDTELSREYLEEAYGALDAPSEICYNLAMVWREAGNRDEMRRYLELYLRKDRGSPWAHEAQRILTE